MRDFPLSLLALVATAATLIVRKPQHLTAVWWALIGLTVLVCMVDAYSLGVLKDEPDEPDTDWNWPTR